MASSAAEIHNVITLASCLKTASGACLFSWKKMEQPRLSCFLIWEHAQNQHVIMLSASEEDVNIWLAPSAKQNSAGFVFKSRVESGLAVAITIIVRKLHKLSKYEWTNYWSYSVQFLIHFYINKFNLNHNFMKYKFSLSWVVIIYKILQSATKGIIFYVNWIFLS